ncbi:hypothetical protein V1277_005618 [Bradyrhizobium sp. AZCC 1588]
MRVSTSQLCGVRSEGMEEKVIPIFNTIVVPANLRSVAHKIPSYAAERCDNR